MTRDDLRAALQEANVRAFLHVIHEGEQGSRSPDVAYRTQFGGGTFDSFADHPREVIRKGGIASTAAGRWQFLSRTWDGLVQQYGFEDFSPESQDEGAVALIAGRGALDDVIAGRFATAIAKCAPEWASLPGSPYGQPTISMDRARRVYEAYGGRYAADDAPPAPITESTVSQPEPRQPMPAPVFAALLPSLISAVPELAKLFGSGSEVAKRNAKAVEILAEVAKTSTASVNEQQAVERIQSDPQARESFTSAVKDRYWELSEAGSGGIGGARKADAERMASGKPIWSSATFVMGALMLPLVYMIAASVTFNLGGAQWDPSVRASLATGIVSLVLGGLAGYYFGASRNAGVGTPPPR